jgi:radial spoke head protein 9
MNISNLASELKFVNKIGQTLSSDERIQLELAVLRLSQEYHFEAFNFWGRIEGIHKNYYMVEGVSFKGVTSFPQRHYFWRYPSLTQLIGLQVRRIAIAQVRVPAPC